MSQVPESPAKRGRRAGPSTTRDAILQAAKRRFARDGFAATTIRQVAADAGVDPALVMQFYRAKDELFAACLEVSPQAMRVMAEAFDGPPDTLGPQIARAFLGLWTEGTEDAPALLAMMRAAVAHEAAGELVRDFVQARLVQVIAPKLGGPDAALRAGLVAAMLMGVVLGRQIVHIPVLTGADIPRIAARIGPALQVVLTGRD
jgi:AcrR family transcriptional regulator